MAGFPLREGRDLSEARVYRQIGFTLQLLSSGVGLSAAAYSALRKTQPSQLAAAAAAHGDAAAAAAAHSGGGVAAAGGGYGGVAAAAARRQ